jgi:hypothetical protein
MTPVGSRTPWRRSGGWSTGHLSRCRHGSTISSRCAIGSCPSSLPRRSGPTRPPTSAGRFTTAATRRSGHPADVVTAVDGDPARTRADPRAGAAPASASGPGTTGTTGRTARGARTVARSRAVAHRQPTPQRRAHVLCSDIGRRVALVVTATPQLSRHLRRSISTRTVMADRRPTRRRAHRLRRSLSTNTSPPPSVGPTQLRPDSRRVRPGDRRTRRAPRAPLPAIPVAPQKTG